MSAFCVLIRGVRAAIPTELLLRLMNATPEQYAAIAKILGVSAECGIRNAELRDRTKGTEGADEEWESENTQHSTSNAQRPKEDEEEERRSQAAATTEEVARSAFALLQKLELDAPLKAPSVLTVFRLYCVDGFSAERVARKCRCAKGTVMSRLRFIEERTGMKPEQFRAMSGHLQQIDNDLRDSGAREIYRRGLSGSDMGNWEQD